MSETSISLRTAEGGDLDRVEALLEANDLPSEDVGTGPATFFLASVDGEFVGVGGLETYDDAGLLRSVVVTEDARGEGYGRTLCAALESRAREAGVDELYLLTTTAAGFFRRCGYETVDRSKAPEVIQKTEEFDELCPDSAKCMHKGL